MQVSHRLAATLLLAGLGTQSANAEPTQRPSDATVVVENIGLHIGGGPNDRATKAPFKKAIETAFGAFRKCYAKAESKSGTFGVDLLVPADGGHAEVSEPRTGMKGEAFRACVVRAFGEVTFEPPKRGATRLSYSLRFTTPD